LAGETAHPDAIANQQVVECAVQRLEEGTPISAIVRIRDLGSGVVEALVAPGVVAGEHMVAGQHPVLLQQNPYLRRPTLPLERLAGISRAAQVLQ
jgi:hypothetical protein